MQRAKHFRTTLRREVHLRYLLHLPRGYSNEQAWPLLMFLHGAGERGSDLRKVAKHGPSRLAHEWPEWPFILVSPQCPAGRTWSNEELLALLHHICTGHAVDRRRVYLTGLSMGGYGTWSLGLEHPARFAALAPVCGGGNVVDVLLPGRPAERALQTLGVWAFHGRKDPVVPVSESERMIAALRMAGVTDARLTIYPEAGHDSWTETYANPALYEWLLSHRRPGQRLAGK